WKNSVPVFGPHRKTVKQKRRLSEALSSLESRESMSIPQRDLLQWPGGKRFAFTIVDDTDRSTVANVGPVYDFLHEQGLATTKTVWPIEPLTAPRTGGQSLEDADYRSWVLELQRRGFEIALHGVADGSSSRERVIAGLSQFKNVVGCSPRIHVNHVGQEECLYWGNDRLDGVLGKLYGLWERSKRTAHKDDSSGHKESSSFFWGDLCEEK